MKILLILLLLPVMRAEVPCLEQCVQLTGVSSELVNGYYTYCNYKNVTLDDRPVFGSGGDNPSLYLYHKDGFWAIGEEAGGTVFNMFVKDNASHPVNISAAWRIPDKTKAWEKPWSTPWQLGTTLLPLEFSVPSPSIKANCHGLSDTRGHVLPTLPAETDAESRRITYGVIGGVVALLVIVAASICIKCYRNHRRSYMDDMDDRLVM